MKNFVCLAAFLAVAHVAYSANPKPATLRPDEVHLTWDDDDVEFCQALGEVKAKSGWGGSQGGGMGEESVKSTIRKRAAALGANVVKMQGMSFDFVTAGHGTAYTCDRAHMFFNSHCSSRRTMGTKHPSRIPPRRLSSRSCRSQV